VIDVCEQGTSIRASIRTAEDVQSVNANWVIGCEGAHSLIRERIGGRFDGHTFPQTFLLGDVRSKPECDEEPAIYLRDDRMLAISALPGRRWRVGVTLPSTDPRHPRGSLASGSDDEKMLPEQVLEHLQHWFNEMKGNKNTQFYDPSWLSQFHIHRRVSSSFRRGHLLIAGDAAHLTSPLGGQGMNSGIGDAFNLGWKLALVVQEHADAILLDTYEEERRPVVDKLARATTQWTSILLGEGRINRILRRYILLPMMRLHLVQGWVLSRRPALQESYRGSRLAPRRSLIHRLIKRGPQPGDIGPDVQCAVLPGTQRVTLGKLINAHWALILFGIREEQAQWCTGESKTRLGNSIRVIRVTTKSYHPAAGYDQIVHDDRRELARAYRAGKNTAILLRPDGHIAWRSDVRDSTGMTLWFDRAFGLHVPGQSTHGLKEGGSHE
jgi:4,5-epoxidase